MFTVAFDQQQQKKHIACFMCVTMAHYRRKAAYVLNAYSYEYYI